MNAEKAMETSRRELAIRPDFCLRDLFNILDSRCQRKLSFHCLTEMLNQLNFKIDDQDLVMRVFQLYDLDKDGYLNYAEFAQLICPRHQDYLRKLRGRVPRIISGSNIHIASVGID